MVDMKKLLEQAQSMQAEMEKKIKGISVEASAGGGMVHVKMNGRKELDSITIEPDIVKEGDVQMLEDLIQAAINEANRQVEKAFQEKLGVLGQGLPIPPGILGD